MIDNQRMQAEGKLLKEFQKAPKNLEELIDFEWCDDVDALLYLAQKVLERIGSLTKKH